MEDVDTNKKKTICLKCGNLFKSRDPKRNRICKNCIGFVNKTYDIKPIKTDEPRSLS